MRILHLAGTLLVSTLLLAQVGLAVTMTLAEHTGYRLVIITGGSMEPTYHVGSGLIVKELSGADITVGMPVTYTSVEGALTTHRVVSLPMRGGKPYLQTQGDANADADPDFTPVEAVAGTPVLHVPFGGYVASFLISPLGRLTIFGPPLALLLWFQVRLIRTYFSRPPNRAQAARARRRNWTMGMVVCAILACSVLTGTLVARSAAVLTSVTVAEATFTTTSLLPPTGVTVTRIGAVNVVAWRPSASGSVAGYRVYRTAGSSSNIRTELGIVDSSTLTVVDPDGNLASGYTIRSYNGSWAGEPSPIVRGD